MGRRSRPAKANERMASPGLAACPDCDLLQRLGDVPEGATALCARCGGVLRRRRRNTIERTLALTLAASVLFAVANVFPFLSFDMKGQVTQTTLLTGVFDLWEQGVPQIAALVGITAVFAPLLQLALLLYVLLPIQLGRLPWQMARAFRLLRHVQPWSMMEVFLVGILVAVTKLVDMASVVPGLALFAFAALIVVLAAASASLDPQAVWERLERSRA
jgi:paraquat-inducible protein A